MKRFGKKVISLLFVVGMISTLLCTFASARSSAYLSSYRAVMTPKSNGALVITVDVTGVGRLPEIGARTIYVYESTDGSYFKCVATYESSDYPKMMGSGVSIFYEDVITHQGTVGRYYYAKAFVYAGDDTGGDERSCNTAIKRAIA